MFNKKYIPAKVFLCVIFLFMFLALLAAVWRKTNKILHADEFKNYAEIDIDWEKLYPFSEHEKIELNKKRPLSKSEKIHEYITKRSEEYTTEKMPGYMKIVELVRKYEKFITWNMSSVFTYNDVIELEGGYLTGFRPSLDITPIIKSTVDFAKFCDENNIEFIYVQAPGKICKYDDIKITNILDFTNQRADDLLNGLQMAKIKNYDLREFLHDERKNHHDAFYKTDHHWKTQTGLWAARHVLRILHQDLNWPVDENILNAENFEFDTYYDCFLGSQGKKLTLVRAKPEDFTLIRPKFSTSFHFEIPNILLNTSGDFEITYSHEGIKNMQGMYSSLFLGDNPLAKLTNLNATNDINVLLVKNSFSNCLVPFLTMGVKKIDAIDMRHFTGSIKNYIKNNKTDIVIILYHTDFIRSPAEQELMNTRWMFDFR